MTKKIVVQRIQEYERTADDDLIATVAGDLLAKVIHQAPTPTRERYNVEVTDE